MAEIIVPVVTVFDRDEKIDYEGNQHVIDYLVRNGVDGILVLGSAGEFTNLSLEDKESLLEFYADYVDGRVKLYAGTGCLRFDETQQLSQFAIDHGYQAAVVIEPYYFGLTQEAAVRFYTRVAESVDGPVFIYNFPARSGFSIDAQSVATLMATHANIVGLKDSVTEAGHTNAILQAVDTNKAAIYSGFDDQFLDNLASGGAGCIGALANVVPDIWHALVQAAEAQQFERSMYLLGLIKRLMPIYDMTSNPAVLLKQLMQHRGVAISTQGVFPFEQVPEAITKQATALLDEVLNEYLQPQIEIHQHVG